jgi:hypothetical protein
MGLKDALLTVVRVPLGKEKINLSIQSDTGKLRLCTGLTVPSILERDAVNPIDTLPNGGQWWG